VDASERAVGRPVLAFGQFASGNYFGVLSIRPALGRTSVAPSVALRYE
jgi:hypothetical protein